MAEALPAHPNLDWLRKTAKQSLHALRTRDGAAKLADAQLALARQHGFASWRALKAEVGRLQRRCAWTGNSWPGKGRPGVPP